MNWFQRRRNLPPVVEAYLEGTPKRVNKKTPLESVRFMVIDAETTGFNVRKDKLLSFAGVEILRNQISMAGIHSWYVYQPEIPVNDSAQVHCILPSDTRSGLPEPLMIEELLPHLQGAVIVGHHVQFDAALLNEGLRRRFQVGLQNTTVDTAALAMISLDAFARTGYANQRPPGLDEVCSLCGIETVDRHTAAGDAFTTAELFLLLCGKLKQRLKRPLHLGDLPLSRP